MFKFLEKYPEYKMTTAIVVNPKRVVMIVLCYHSLI